MARQGLCSALGCWFWVVWGDFGWFGVVVDGPHHSELSGHCRGCTLQLALAVPVAAFPVHVPNCDKVLQGTNPQC